MCSGRTPTPISRAGMRRRIGKMLKSLKTERRLRPLAGLEDAADDPLLDRELQPLRELHRRGAPGLDRLKILVRRLARAERAGEPVGRGDRVLHRDIDPHAADRRHRMRGIADADEPGPRPFSQPIHRDAEQLDVVPGLQFADAAGQKRRHLDDPSAERLEALRLHPLDPALGDDDRRIASSRRGRA